MNLEEEITINQFGQGIHSSEGLLSHFSQLAEGEKWQHLFDLSSLVKQLDPSDSEIDRVMGTISSDHPDFYSLGKAYHEKRSLIINMAMGEIDRSYSSLLDLFKAAYQRHFALKKGNPDKWQYQDLSNRKIVQNILARHQKLIEEVYNDSGFRGEFISLAKLWNDRSLSMRADAENQEAVPLRQTRFNFLNYDEMITASLKMYDDKCLRSITALRNSLNKALSIRYGLATGEAPRLTLAVIARHLQETYYTGLS